MVKDCLAFLPAFRVSTVDGLGSREARIPSLLCGATIRDMVFPGLHPGLKEPLKDHTKWQNMASNSPSVISRSYKKTTRVWQIKFKTRPLHRPEELRHSREEYQTFFWHSGSKENFNSKPNGPNFALFYQFVRTRSWHHPTRNESKPFAGAALIFKEVKKKKKKKKKKK